MNATIDIWIVLFIAAAAQGIFLSMLLLFKKGKKKGIGQHLLGALILSFTVTIAYYTTFWMGVNPRLPFELRAILQFTYLLAPLAWMYLFHTLNNRIPRLAWLHFVPFVVMATLFLYKPFIVPSVPIPFPALQIIHLMIYSVFNLLLVKQTNQNQWAKNVALSFAGYVLCFLAYYVLLWTGVLKLQHDYMVSFGMTIFIYFIGYHGFKAPTFFDGIGNGQKYRKSSLTDNSIHYIVQKLDRLMLEKKLYTQGDLKLQEVAKALDISVHALSQAVNVEKKKKFTDYLNELRVEEAKKLMDSEEYRETKLLAVAIDAGFNNKTSFLNAFKRYTGQSPSEYRKGIAA